MKGAHIARRKLSVLMLLSGIGLSGCADPAAEALKKGQQIWEGTCKVCHLNGIAGAPPMGNSVAWKPRIEKGEATLVSHALNGFTGNEGTMPPRGGKPALTDEDVTLAVRYMIHNSQ
ncbi:MAG: cytochrome c5 family protein [Hahellaceae bacterium]|nr:cytochrome c5 family protein [Hahellaceae bacterium]